MNTGINFLIKEILTRNQDHTNIAIQQLFDLIPIQQAKDSIQNIQKAILFSLENLHQWQNIAKYIQKWNMLEYRKGLIIRMKRRLNENQGDDANSPYDQDELKRLITLYYRKINPKKAEHSYREIDVDRLSNLEKHQNIEVAQNYQSALKLPQNDQNRQRIYPKLDLSRIIKKNKLSIDIDKQASIENAKISNTNTQVKIVAKNEQQRPLSSLRLCKIIKNQQKKDQSNPQRNPINSFKFDSNKKSDRKISISKFNKATKYDPSEVNSKLYSFNKWNPNKLETGKSTVQAPNNYLTKPIVIKKSQENIKPYQFDSFDSFKERPKQQTESTDAYETRLLIRQIRKQLKEQKESKQFECQYLKQSSSKNIKDSLLDPSKQDLYKNLRKMKEEIKLRTMKFFYQCFQ